jgi:hypothetical protein
MLNHPLCLCLVLTACTSESPGNPDQDTAPPDSGETAFAGDVDANPAPIEGVLTNTGIGFADFHFGWWCNLPPITFTPEECAPRVESHWPENYPDAGTAYFRWTWADLEPERGALDTELIDTTIQSANLLGETLGFRVMAIEEGGYGVPQWLTEEPYAIAGEWIDSMFWPDVRDTTFQAEHERFLSALGERYNGHPGVDHVDIGTVGCWGEWNTACLSTAADLFEVYAPSSKADEDAIQSAYASMIDHHLSAFPDTPTVMLGIGGEVGREAELLTHATAGGAGWRVDCWGDYGFWGSGWNHMDDYYPSMIDAAIATDPDFETVWQHAPVLLEVCGVMGDWENLGWTTDVPDGEVHKSFQWSLDVHASVLNAKFSDIPSLYTDAIDELLVENGYRLALNLLNHDSVVDAGETLTLSARWSNLGTAPAYHPRTVTWRLRGDTEQLLLASGADIRTWLPGEQEVVEAFSLPVDLPTGAYVLEVALLDRAGVEPTTEPLPATQLAMEGRDADGWYPVSVLTVE